MRKFTLALALLAAAFLVATCSQNESPTGPQPLNVGQSPRALLPDSATLDSAILELHVETVSGQQVTIHRVTSTWMESMVTWNSFAASYDTMAAAALAPADTGWVSVDVSTLVDAWLDSTYENFGLLLDETLDTLYAQTCFSTREAGEPAPVLTLYCTCPDSSIMLMLTAAADAHLAQEFPDSNFGTEKTMCTGWSGIEGTEVQSLVWFDVPRDTMPEDLGCTYSKGYWKNHAGMGPQEDLVTELLPQTLGNGGGKSIEVVDAETAYKILKQHSYGHPSNGVTKLYAQLLAAKLNIENGAASDAVDEAITNSDAFLTDYDWNDWCTLDKDARNKVLHWKGTLDQYNNGMIGPGHCDWEGPICDTVPFPWWPCDDSTHHWWCPGDSTAHPWWPWTDSTFHGWCPGDSLPPWPDSLMPWWPHPDSTHHWWPCADSTHRHGWDGP